MDIEEGKIYTCTVIKTVRSGIIVKIGDSEETEFIHISELSEDFINDTRDFIRVGTIINAIGYRWDGGMTLSLKRVPEEDKKEEVPDASAEDEEESMEKLLEAHGDFSENKNQNRSGRRRDDWEKYVWHKPVYRKPETLEDMIREANNVLRDKERDLLKRKEERKS